jgi:hypothetical protein
MIADIGSQWVEEPVPIVGRRTAFAVLVEHTSTTVAVPVVVAVDTGMTIAAFGIHTDDAHDRSLDHQLTLLSAVASIDNKCMST